MPNMWSQTTVNGVAVARDARVPHHSNWEKGPTFRFVSVCEDEDGRSWRGEVELAGQVILRTESFADHGAAGNAAERLLAERFLTLLRGDKAEG